MMACVNGATGEPESICGSEDRLLELRGLSKSFGGVPVLRDINLSIHSGEVHAIMGENGAGKSTLLKILAGVHLPDSGEVRLAGRDLKLGSARAALKAGIAMIYQELMPFLDLTIAENILIGQEPARGPFRWIDKAAMRLQSRELLASLGVELSLNRKMRQLSVAEMQTVEIAKALAHRARVILMDEPTSALSERETEALFRVIAELRRRGAAVVYISHKVEEVFRVASRVTVLRDGMLIATRPARTLTREALIGLMVGRSLDSGVKKPLPANTEVALSVRRLGLTGRFRDVSFDVRHGEVLGLAGLMGAGRTDVLNAIYGLQPAGSGEIRVNGNLVRIGSPQDGLRAGIGLVTEDRKRFGFIPALPLRSNLTLAALRRWCHYGFINAVAENRVANEQIRAFSIRAANQHQLVQHLSGGNQQKVVLARTLLAEPQILLLDEPTRGIDLGAKVEVHALITRLAQSGKAVVLVSSELPELMSLSHRIVVMRQGMLAAELQTSRTSGEEILNFAMPN